MEQTFYIESDEEIISIIGKLRTSPGDVNYFVLPKRALVLQSIVNLKLLQREADKQGKKIILVTQDDIGQNLAGKVGIETERYSDEFSEKKSHLELTPAPQISQNTSNQVSSNRVIPRSDMIGSAEFNSVLPSAENLSVATPPQQNNKMDDMRLKVRNATPAGLTSLNSRRVGPQEMSAPAQGVSPRIQASFAPAPVISSTPGAAQDPQSLPSKNPKLEKFFAAPNTLQNRPAGSKLQKPIAPQPGDIGHHRSVRTVFFLLGFLTLLIIGGVASYLFFPKAEIHITPFEMTKAVSSRYVGLTSGGGNEPKTVPVRLLEKEIAVEHSVEATGTTAASNQKARGTLIITNNFSTEPQPLVATTRFEDSNGKIFRLAQGITVPGLSGTTPGTIQALVIADESGSEYNIGATTFTIPGFKGNPKYEKITARSEKAMIGGGDGGSNMKAVAQADLDRVKNEALEKARKQFLTEVAGELAGGERILESQMEIAPLSAENVVPAGTIANILEYSNRFRIRAFVIPEETIRSALLSEGIDPTDDITFEAKSAVLDLTGSQVLFDQGRVDIEVNATLQLVSVIDENGFKERILGQNEEGITALLVDFPEIKKIEVRFEPRGLISTVPKRAERVTIIRKEGELPE